MRTTAKTHRNANTHSKLKCVTAKGQQQAERHAACPQSHQGHQGNFGPAGEKDADGSVPFGLRCCSYLRPQWKPWRSRQVARVTQRGKLPAEPKTCVCSSRSMGSPRLASKEVEAQAHTQNRTAGQSSGTSYAEESTRGRRLAPRRMQRHHSNRLNMQTC